MMYIRLKAIDRVQNKSEGLVYYENNSEAWNVSIQQRGPDGDWIDIPLVYVDPNYVGEGEKAEKVK